ncbi:MAG: TonB-dependent receptor [Bacteroidota bacterium]
MPKPFWQVSLALLLLLPYVGRSQTKHTLSGYVRDANTGEALIGANIWCTELKAGTAANTFGFYSLTLPTGDYSLTISAVGYQTETISLNLRQDQTRLVTLSSQTSTLDEVVVEGRQLATEMTQMSKRTLAVEQLKALPSFMGEVDVIKTVQFLPGVSRGSEGNNSLYVRGGSADQNLILLDGVPVYNANHVFGFLSVFNGDALQGIDLYTGGFPARYGGRLSSVLDITMREGNQQELKGMVSVGLVASKALLEGPIGDKTSFLVTARRTYFDLVTTPFIQYFNRRENPNTTLRPRAFFTDFNGKINHRFSDRSRLYFSIYAGEDELSNNAETTEEDDELNTQYINGGKDGLQWGNTTAALRWNYVFTPQLFANTSLTYSRYGFDVFFESYQQYPDVDTIDERFHEENYRSFLQDITLRTDLDWSINTQHTLSFGASLTRQTFEPGAYSVRSSQVRDTTIGAPSQQGWRGFAYVEDEFRFGEQLSGRLGLHLATFATGEAMYPSLQPRASLRWQFQPEVALKASYARMQQPLHMLVTSGIGLPIDQWVPATERIAPAVGWVTALGVAAQLPKNLTLSVEGYYKEMDGVLEYRDGFGFTDSRVDWQDKVAVGRGTSYGAEVLLQKPTGRFTGWVGYTLGWSWREFEELNFGERFPFRYDRRHTVVLAASGQIKENIKAGLTWTYATGEALTLPQGRAPYADLEEYPNEWNLFQSWRYQSEYNYYGTRNSSRMPDYHRLDLSISFDKQKPRGLRTWTFGVYNAYGRRNPLYLDLGYSAESVNGGPLVEERYWEAYSPVPAPIPYFSYQFTF